MPGLACKGHGPTRVWTWLLPAGCGARHLASRVLLAIGGAGRGECEAAPLWTVPEAVGKGLTLEWTRSRAGCGPRQPAAGAPLAVGRAGHGEGKAAPLWAVPGATGRSPILVWTCPRPA